VAARHARTRAGLGARTTPKARPTATAPSESWPVLGNMARGRSGSASDGHEVAQLAQGGLADDAPRSQLVDAPERRLGPGCHDLGDRRGAHARQGVQLRLARPVEIVRAGV